MEETKKADIQNYGYEYHKINEKANYFYELTMFSQKLCQCGVVAADFATKTFVVTKSAFAEYFPDYKGNQMCFMGINFVKEEEK